VVRHNQVLRQGNRKVRFFGFLANSEIIDNFRAERVRTGQHFLKKWRRKPSQWIQETLFVAIFLDW
jgi:hypothetical protein